MLNFALLQKLNINLDLATEAHSLLRGTKNLEIPGVKETVENKKNLKITNISILDNEGAKIMGRPQGEYITIDVPLLLTSEENSETIHKETATAIGELLKNLIPMGNAPILICGLGNPHISSDALGPKVIKSSMATRHLFLYMAEHMEAGFSDVALIAPNVMGNTGIETVEIIESIAKEIKAKAVIVIDALAAASFKRVGSSFQIANTGITPGAGVGNTRKAINEETLGIPVIAIGVPTVVLLSTVMGEAISAAANTMQNKNNADSFNEESAANIIEKLLSEHHDNFAVTPKDIDELIQKLSNIIIAGLHIALHAKLNINNYHEYLNL
ncbi:MAG: GPR endopeptidase [Clostridiales bacterium]